MKNIPYVVDVVVPMWSPPVGDSEFRRFDVEYIVRSSIFENDSGSKARATLSELLRNSNSE